MIAIMKKLYVIIIKGKYPLKSIVQKLNNWSYNSGLLEHVNLLCGETRGYKGAPTPTATGPHSITVILVVL